MRVPAGSRLELVQVVSADAVVRQQYDDQRQFGVHPAIARPEPDTVA